MVNICLWIRIYPEKIFVVVLYLYIYDFNLRKCYCKKQKQILFPIILLNCVLKFYAFLCTFSSDHCFVVHRQLLFFGVLIHFEVAFAR